MSPTPPRAARASAALAAAALLAAGAAQQIAASSWTSAVVDEPAHLTAGWLSVARGDLSVNREHPPLVKALAALPLFFLDPVLPPIDPLGPRPGTEDFEFDYSRRFLYGANDADALLRAARLPVVGLTALLGLLVFAWTREIAGAGGALAALALLVTEPNVLGHGRLVTTDLGAALFSLAFLWSLRRAIRGGSIPAAVRTGILLGCVLLSKFSTLILLPLALVLVLLDRLGARGGRGAVGAGGPNAPGPPAATSPAGGPTPPPGRLALTATVIVLGAWLVLEAGYLLDGLPLPRLYLEGLALSLNKNVVVEGPTYLMGKISPDGFWSYYVVGLAVKTPIPLLALALLGSAAALGRASTRREAAWILLPAAAWIGAMTVLTKAQIGVRYVLPAIPLLCVAAGIGAARLLEWTRWKPPARGEEEARPKSGARANAGPHPRSAAAAGGASRFRLASPAILVVFLGWQAVAAFRIYPHHLAYFNEAAGGPENGWRWLADSNLDWGQDLVGLRRWLDTVGDPPINLYYFGAADPDHYKIRRHPPDAPRPGWFAVSATQMVGVYLPEPDYLAVFRTLRPDLTIGHSILLFRLDEVPPRLRTPLRWNPSVLRDHDSARQRDG